MTSKKGVGKIATAKTHLTAKKLHLSVLASNSVRL
jgi:hypothetical protein